MRSQRARVVRAVNKIFKKLGDLVEVGRLRRLDDGYSQTTGVVGTPGVDDTCSNFNFVQLKQSSLEALGKMIASVNEDQMAAAMKHGEIQLLAQAKGMTLVPETEDEVELKTPDAKTGIRNGSTDEKWDLVKSDPLFGAGFILTVRRQNA